MKRSFGDVSENDIDWPGTRDLHIKMLEDSGFEVIKNVDQETWNSHEYIEFLSRVQWATERFLSHCQNSYSSSRQRNERYGNTK